ncbi:MAG: cyclic nucleotide-binding domain-containing protein [Endomicrobium sp.]|jgi:CRP/FNR family transcriptional regulator|nr:cyclic nucleotide-binding domain-containing protein [Endomicrobium sp.]
MLKKLFKFIFIDKSLKDDVEFLKKVALFSGLSDKALRKIALILFKKTYIAGERIYKEKQEAEVLYLVKEGQVKISGLGNEKIIGQGSFFGEISLFKDRKHDSSAIAAQNCELYLVYRVKFDDMVEDDAKIGLKIMKNLSAIFSVRLKCVEV